MQNHFQIMSLYGQMRIHQSYYPGYYNLYTKVTLTAGSSSANAICVDDSNIYNYVSTTSGSTTLYVIDNRRIKENINY